MAGGNRRSCDPTLIRVIGGLPGEPTHATIDGEQINRRPHEPLPAFEVRALAEAKAGGHPVLLQPWGRSPRRRRNQL